MMIKIQSWLSIPQPHNAQYKLIFVQWEPCMPSCLQLAVTVVVLGTVKVSHKQLKHQEGVWTHFWAFYEAPLRCRMLPHDRFVNYRNTDTAPEL